MTFAELKAQVRAHMTDDQVRTFGKLTTKATWEAAFDRCQEAIANAADKAKEIATSDEAIVCYEAIFTVVKTAVLAVVLVATVIGLGFWELGKRIYADIQPKAAYKAYRIKRRVQAWLRLLWMRRAMIAHRFKGEAIGALALAGSLLSGPTINIH